MRTDTPPAWTVTPGKLDEARRRIVEAARPWKIILFGSRARGDARPDSDADLLIIETEVQNPAAESVRLRRVLKDLQLPVDLLVVSRAKYDYWRGTPGTVYFEASLEGKVIYEAA
jgi:predicted nucleotidyltransferase